MVHAFNPSTWEAEAGEFLSSRTAWSTEWVPGQPGLYRKPLSWKKNHSRGHLLEQCLPCKGDTLKKDSPFPRHHLIFFFINRLPFGSLVWALCFCLHLMRIVTIIISINGILVTGQSFYLTQCLVSFSKVGVIVAPILQMWKPRLQTTRDITGTQRYTLGASCIWWMKQ